MKTTCVVLVLLQVITYVPTQSAKYVGGTVSTIPPGATGALDVSDEKELSFKWKKDGEWRVPYEKITSVEYGQHAGRRVGATVATAVATVPLFGIPALPILFSKKRRHYVTIDLLDERGKPQAAIFNVGKKAILVTLKTLEVRTGKKVQYEDEEARRAGNK